jgi:hypothetical protein
MQTVVMMDNYSAVLMVDCSEQKKAGQTDHMMAAY